jgi:MSHA biogenesis protein MshL
MNNQKAVIKLTTKEVSWLSNAVYNAQGQVSFKYSTPQVDEVGIFLDVTPQINEKGTVSMQIHPSISEKSKTSTSPDGTSSKPIIDIREVDTMIEVRNGETVVIAGLIVDKIVETRRSVPFLGDIPFLGALFRYVTQEKKKTELVILITPYLLTEKSVAEIRKEHEERLKKAGREFSATPLPQ